MLRSALFVVPLLITAACQSDDRPTAPEDGAEAVTLLGAAGDWDDEDSDDGGRPLQSDEVEATLTFAYVKGKFRLCDGEDGFYVENHALFTGTAAGDPRLTGTFELRVNELFNFDEWHGPQWGRLTIRDATSRRVKATAEYANWGPFEWAKGTLVGRLHDRGAGGEPTSGPGRLHANWQIRYTAIGPVAQIGGTASESRMPAGVFSGRCSGPFEFYEQAEGGAAAAIAAGSGRRGRVPLPPGLVPPGAVRE